MSDRTRSTQRPLAPPAPPTNQLERLYTFEKALEFLPFPSEEALRKYLERRPGIVEIRHWHLSRTPKRVLSESDIRHLQEILSSTFSPGR